MHREALDSKRSAELETVHSRMHKGEPLACSGFFLEGLPSSAAEHEKSLKECVRATLGLQSSIGLESLPGVDGMASRLGLPWSQVLSVLVIAVPMSAAMQRRQSFALHGRHLRSASSARLQEDHVPFTLHAGSGLRSFLVSD